MSLGESCVTKIKTTKKVRFAITSFSTDDKPLDVLLQMLDNHDMIEELTVAWNPSATRYGSSYLQNQYVFPHLETLVLIHGEIHHLAGHINGPLLERVELVDKGNDQDWYVG